MTQAVEEWNVPYSTRYYIHVGVAIGKSGSDGEPENDRVWDEGFIFIPKREEMNREYSLQMIHQCKVIILNVLDSYPYLSNINCVTLECCPLMMK